MRSVRINLYGRRILVAVAVIGAALDFFFPVPGAPGVVTAGLLGALVTGAGVVTTFAGQAQCESMIVIGDVDTANPLRGLSIEIDGVPFINIPASNLALIGAYAKYMSQVVGTVVGLTFKVATGRVPRTTTYRFTNDAATTPNIYAISDADNGVPLLAATEQINASSYQDFDRFSALFIGTPASLTSAEIEFTNGYRATYTQFELQALFALKNQAEANGDLNAVTVIDNRDQSIRRVRLNCSAANTILKLKLPDASFEELKKAATSF